MSISLRDGGYGYSSIYLFNAAGGSIVSDGVNNYGHYYGGSARIARFEIPASGTYYVGLYCDTAGSYDLKVERSSSVDLEYDRYFANDYSNSGNALAFTASGTTRMAKAAATLDYSYYYGVDIDHFSLGTVNAGNTVEASAGLLAGSTLTGAKLSLVSATDGTVAEDADGDPSDAHLAVTVPADGIWSIRAEATGGHGTLARYLLSASLRDDGAPKVASLSGLPADGAATNVPPTGFSLTFSEDLDPATVKVNPPVIERDGRYYTLTPTQMSWTDAEAWAAAHGGHLASIADATQALRHGALRASGPWIGASYGRPWGPGSGPRVRQSPTRTGRRAIRYPWDP